VLAAGGIRDILIANQVVGERKVRRLVHLAAHTDVIVAVDSLVNVRALAEAAAERNVCLGVLVEVNIGNERCGVEPLDDTVAFVKALHARRGLRFRGLMGYDGHLAFVGEDERMRRSVAAYELLVATRDRVVEAGIPVEIVSGGGTSTFRSAAQVAGVTELQLGSYIFNDTTYRDAGLSEFDCALTVLSTVISRPDRASAADVAILDVGRKSLSVQNGLPEMKSPAGQIFSMPQEHSRLRLPGPTPLPAVGDTVEIMVRDSNGTVNLFDHLYALRGDRVEAVWDLPGRGKAT
jgi:D-serine deaminase-like pyridoxal phosphate-dependent protein